MASPEIVTMSIRRDKGELVAECDECGTEFPGGVQDDFRTFIQELKDAGWKIRKDGETWEHICPDCQE